MTQGAKPLSALILPLIGKSDENNCYKFLTFAYRPVQYNPHASGDFATNAGSATILGIF